MQTDTKPEVEFGIPAPFWRGRDALIVADAANGRILGWNPAAADLFGYAADEVSTLTLAALFPAIERAGPDERIAALGAIAPFDVPRATLARRKSGLDFAIEITLTALDPPSGSEGRVLAVLRDLAGQARSQGEIERLLEESEALQAVAAALASERDAARLLDGIVERALAVLGADGCFIWLYDDDGRWRIVAARGLSDRYLAKIAGASLDRLSASFRNPVEARRPAFNPDLQGAVRPLNPALADAYEAEGLVSALRLPLFASDDRIDGALVLYHRRERIYSDAEIRLAQAFANQIAVALHNTRLAEQERAAREAAARRLERVTTLAGITERLVGVTELQTVLDIVVESASRLCDASGALVMLVDPDGLSLRPRAVHGALAGLAQLVAGGERLTETYRSSTAMGQAIDQGTAIVVEDYATWPAMPERRTRAVAMGVRAFVIAPLRVGGTPIGVLLVGDPTPRTFAPEDVALVQALADQAALAIEHARRFERERQTARELSSLLEVSHNLASTLDLETVLDLILELLQRVIDYRGATIGIVEGDEVVVAGSRAVSPERAGDKGLRFKLDRWGPIIATLEAGRPVVIDDVRGDSPEAANYRALNAGLMERPTHRDIRAWMAVPLLSKDRMIGHLTMSQDVPAYFTVHHADLASAFATQAALAIENAGLYKQERQTAQELSSLLEVSHNLASTLELERLLDVVLDQLTIVAEYDGASIVILEDDRLRTLRRRASTRADVVPGPPEDVPIERARDWWRLITAGRVVMVGDMHGDEPLARAYRSMVSVPWEQSRMRYVRSWMAAPLTLRDRVIGAIILGHADPHTYTQRQADLAVAIAAQAAAAIENARLYGEARKVAVLEERQRLARELHDSVSQALFGIGLGARTTRTLLERQNTEKALGSVEYVISLAEAGMAEMRALLFELRPESLATEGLVAALTKQAAVLTLRHELAVATEFCEEPAVSLEIKEACYRIAQEALHNIVKHARARSVAVHLVSDADAIALSVRDDGVGFDPSGSFPGHIGQHSMRERAARLGGRVTVESAPGQGSCVTVTIPREPR